MNSYKYISEYFLKEQDEIPKETDPAKKVNPMQAQSPKSEDSYLPKDGNDQSTTPNDPQDPTQDPNQEDDSLEIQTMIGRTYELKKIYSKLLSISKLLDNYSAQKFELIRKDIDEALELFDLVSTNLDSFQEKIDEIIIYYYNFMNDIIKTIEVMARSKDKENENK